MSVFEPERQGEMLDAGSGSSLVVHDVDDEEMPYNDSVQLTHRTRKSRLVSTRGAGHRRILRMPRVVELISAFIAER